MEIKHTTIGPNRLKIVAEYKRITRQRGSFRVVVLCVAGLAALVAGIWLRTMQNPSFTTVSGNEIDWRNEQWTVVNYFAEWCAPCLRELPELNGFYQQGSARVIGVSFDELSQSELQAVITRQSIAFPVLKTESAAALPVSMPIVLPTTYIISPAGEVTKTIRGEVTVERLNEALAQSQQAVNFGS